MRTVGGIGAVLTCPCHIVPLVLLAGGTAGGAWLARYLPALTILFGAVFLVSVWLLLRPERASAVADAACATCGPERIDGARGVAAERPLADADREARPGLRR